MQNKTPETQERDYTGTISVYIKYGSKPEISELEIGAGSKFSTKSNISDKMPSNVEGKNLSITTADGKTVLYVNQDLNAQAKKIAGDSGDLLATKHILMQTLLDHATQGGIKKNRCSGNIRAGN